MENIISFEDYSVNENINLEHETFFNKTVTHDEALRKNVKDGLIHIIMEEQSISEKAFTQIDKISDIVEGIINDDILTEAEKHLQENRRMKLFYELIYENIQSKLDEKLNI